MPNWLLAQPFRFLAHNGEINTLQGNRNWMRAREAELTSPVWGDAFESLRPIIWEEGSDSASLDNALELLEESGRDVLHSMMMLVPPAWENMAEMEPRLRDFYRYHDTVVEPWDGPAGLAFTDGMTVGAVLDRNGLRPSRYKIDQDGLVVAASEVGVVDMDDATIVEKGRLGPGQMLAVDTVRHRILHNDDLKREISERRPYGEWLSRGLVSLGSLPSAAPSGSNGQAGANGHAHAATNGHAANGQNGVAANLRRRAASGRHDDRCRRPDPDPARLRLHRRRGQVHHPADGRRGQGPRLLDGRRHPDGGPLAGAAPALHLLQAAVRPGHQPADRPAPRGAGDVAADADRAAPLDAGGDAGARPPAGAGEPGPAAGAAGEADAPPTPTRWWPAPLDTTFPVAEGPAGLERGVDDALRGRRRGGRSRAPRSWSSRTGRSARTARRSRR